MSPDKLVAERIFRTSGCSDQHRAGHKSADPFGAKMVMTWTNEGSADKNGLKNSEISVRVILSK